MKFNDGEGRVTRLSCTAIDLTGNRYFVLKDGSNAAMSTVPQHLPGSSVGFGPQGFGPSAQHFSQPPPPFGPLLAPQPPAAAAAVPGPAQQFDYGHS